MENPQANQPSDNTLGQMADQMGREMLAEEDRNAKDFTPAHSDNLTPEEKDLSKRLADIEFACVRAVNLIDNGMESEARAVLLDEIKANLKSQ